MNNTVMILKICFSVTTIFVISFLHLYSTFSTLPISMVVISKNINFRQIFNTCFFQKVDNITPSVLVFPLLNDPSVQEAVEYFLAKFEEAMSVILCHFSKFVKLNHACGT